MPTTQLRIRKKGSLTLPVDLRNKYHLDEGIVLTLIDLGNGSFMLKPRNSEVKQLGNRVVEALESDNVSLNDLLTTLDEERERYYREQNAD